MNILALDTSSEYCSVALWRAGALEGREVHAGQRHSELVLAMIDELLTHHGLRVTQLDGIAYGAGPGAFTGLRIACGVTQGIALAGGIPVVGVETLLAMAEYTQAGRVVCCVDARMHEIYHAAYERMDDGWRPAAAPSVCAPSAAPLLPGGGWLGAGNGFAVHAAALGERYADSVWRIDAEVHSRAQEIVCLAIPAFEQGRAVDAGQALPLYIRNKVALAMHEQR